MPRRWPRQIGVKMSSARKPVSIRAPISLRLSAAGGGWRSRTPRRPCGSAPRPSIGRPRLSTTRPSQASEG
ncbi:hypothetical protein [Pseudoroseomonas cervicalis]|uniref:hypothetical protein n=1 Tax=Teichococcus cervicalis TaxID=204525 RepID=UPI00278AA681|nr:hypothetical protein [Pseudoroseomonas cervicalis]MDQ1077594.1 hypothetical protein [Pseudoroseomonas cervicalis]